MAKVEDVKPEMLSGYDLIGLGSGIYASKIHRRMFKFIKRCRSGTRMSLFSAHPDLGYSRIKRWLRQSWRLKAAMSSLSSTVPVNSARWASIWTKKGIPMSRISRLPAGLQLDY